MIITCEHGGNEVPGDYARWFASPGAAAALRSHRGYDPGALMAARYIANHASSTLIHSVTTRLLVDLNRSESNPGIWSRYSDSMDETTKTRVLNQFYRPYRQSVIDAVQAMVASNKLAVHLSVHTFTPRFRGTRRAVDLGILFDPNRRTEAVIANRWCGELKAQLPRSRVAANQPYLGTDDGLTTWLRTQFAEDRYVGIEIEIANTIAKRSAANQRKFLQNLSKSFDKHRCLTF